jgi:hypothetical protein
MHFSQAAGQVFGLQAKVEMIRFNICMSLLLFCFTQGFAATDVYVSAGTAKARYSESTDGQNADLVGTEQFLSIRNINSLGKIDLGLDAGTLKLNGDSQAHQADFEGNYINLISGVSFSLYPSWVEFYLDVGYRFGLGKLTVQRSQYKYTFNGQMSGQSPNYGAIFKSGVKAITSSGYLIGLNFENKGKLLDQSSLSLNPRVHSSTSVTISLGYRFGGNNATSPTSTPSGTPNYSDPCRLFGACN